MKRGPIGVSDEAERFTYYLLLLGIKILEDVVPGAYDSQGDREGVQQILVLGTEKREIRSD